MNLNPQFANRNAPPRNSSLLFALWGAPFLSVFAFLTLFSSQAETADDTAPENQPLESDALTDADITAFELFDEPLVPIGRVSSTHDQERSILMDALEICRDGEDLEQVAPLTEFLDLYPDSAWRILLWTNLGVVYRRTGYYSRALQAFEQAWDATWEEALSGDPQAPEAPVEQVADRALGELATLYASLGRTAELEALLDEVDAMQVRGFSTQKLSRARQGLWLMKAHPEKAYRCGPFAISSILRKNSTDTGWVEKVAESQSSTEGLSLTQVFEFATQMSMRMQRARREPGAAFLYPAVVHWRSGHYAALLQQQTVEEGEGETRTFVQVEDTTFGPGTWLSLEAVSDESSGYFLVPEGPLPEGWNAVEAAEGDTVWGRGNVGAADPTQTTADSVKAKACGAESTGMPTYNFHLMLASLNIVDTPLAYSPPVGPRIACTLTYNHREDEESSALNYANVGPKWTYDWLSYVTDVPGNPLATVTVRRRGGGKESYPKPGSNLPYDTHYRSHAVLTRVSSTPIRYERELPDGTVELFGHSQLIAGGRRVFMTGMKDPQGNGIQFTWSTSHRLNRVTDTMGKETVLIYTDPFNTHLITGVQDPYQRQASLTYHPPSAGGYLHTVSDTAGLATQFEYGSEDLLDWMNTPYGITTFTAGETFDLQGNRLEATVTATDPLGNTERVEYLREAPIPAVDTVGPPAGMTLAYNGYLQYRNSFYWDKRQWAVSENLGPEKYANAHLFHWLHLNDDNTASGVLESEKRPLENRLWYTYQGQTTATYLDEDLGTQDRRKQVGRVIDPAGTAQVYTTVYNTRGKVTESQDPLLPVARKICYTYPNGIDLSTVKQVVAGGSEEQLLKLENYVNHQPKKLTDAAGQIVNLAYNSHGQMTTRSTTRSVNGVPTTESVTYTYEIDGDGVAESSDGDYGYLRTFTGAAKESGTVFSYDKDLMKTSTLSDGYQRTYDFDGLQRLTRITYPDATFDTVDYDRLDPWKVTDRLGKVMEITYNALQQVTQVKDPMNQVTMFGWCGCGTLESLTDPKNQVTTWEYDLQGRLQFKHPADDSSSNDTTWTWAYEPQSGRLSTVTDAEGQITKFDYWVDNNVKKLSYLGSGIATPSVDMTYDPYTNRLVTRTDGQGISTHFYHPVGSLGALQVSSVDGPWADDTVSFTYEELGRVKDRTIQSMTSTAVYDSLGRLSNLTDPLGSFAHLYAGNTGRLQQLTHGASGIYTGFAYDTPLGDRRLLSITHHYSSGVQYSQSSYTWRDDDRLATWKQSFGPVGNQTYLFKWEPSYDDAWQLDTIKDLDTQAVKFDYDYDSGANRTAEVTPGTSTTWTYANPVNQISTQLQGGTPRTFVHDKNGSITSDGLRTFTWDRARRLKTIDDGTVVSQYEYDGWSRLVKLTETVITTQVSTVRSFLWCGEVICEERDGTGATVVRRFFPYGMQEVVGGVTTSYYTTRDRLGSVRELRDGTGATVARWDYDPFGRPTQIAGAPRSPVMGYTGHLYHAQTGLWLTHFRAYDPALGRWLSRDPIAEAGGVNLYGYVGNDPGNFVDPDGRDVFTPVFAGFAGDVAIPDPTDAAWPKWVGWAGALLEPRSGTGLRMIGPQIDLKP